MEKTEGLWPHIARISVIAAIYAALTIVCILVEGSLSWGPIQFRLSEVLCVLALFTYDAIPGLAIGCGIANIINLGISGIGTYTVLDFTYSVLAALLGSVVAWRFRDRPIVSLSGLLAANAIIIAILRLSFGSLGTLDVVFGSLASAIAASFTWRHRDRLAVAIAGPVVANALIIPLYLPLMAKGTGFYTIPFTEVSVESSYPLMVLFGILSIGIGEAVVMYAIGLPLARALKGTRIEQLLAPKQ